MILKGRYGKYQIVKKIAEGGFSKVYLARSKEDMVVVKTPKSEVPISFEIIREEANILKVISTPTPHENIVAFVDWIPSYPALVQEYVPGPSLDKVYGKRRARKEEAVRLVLGVLSALNRMHSLGLVHGDVKPNNIMMPRPLVPVLIDMGSAKRAGSTSLAGTPGWSSPEFMEGQVSVEADIYSVGVLLLYLISGVDPIEPLTPEDVPSTIPDQVSEVIRRALNPNPWKRFHSAKEMEMALMGLKIPRQEGPRLIAGGKVILLEGRSRLIIARSRTQGGTGKADIELYEFGGRRLIPRGPPYEWIEVVKVGNEYWVSDKGSPAGVWVFRGEWKRVVDYPLNHGDLISIGIRRRAGRLYPYAPLRYISY